MLDARCLDPDGRPVVEQQMSLLLMDDESVVDG